MSKPASTPASWNGVVVVDKSPGMTSHDVVYHARKLFHCKRIGHTGTLDPDATGVLVLCLGQATRLAEYLSAARKHYAATVLFGVTTDTEDASGVTLETRDAGHLTEADVRALLPRFRGTIQQTPPMVSALHHEGQRLYDLARKGVEVPRAARTIEIDALEMTAFTPSERPVANLEITCSTGTYIRTLAADLGRAAGTGGLMQTLRRTWVGESVKEAFTLADAHTLDALRERAANGTLAQTVLPLAAALRGWPQVRLTPAQVARIHNGQAVALHDLAPDAVSALEKRAQPEAAGTKIALLDEDENVCAIARLETDRLQPIKVFTHDEGV